MGPRAGLDRCGKSRPPPRFDPRTVQPVASRYTDYATRPTGSYRVFSLLFDLERCTARKPASSKTSRDRYGSNDIDKRKKFRRCINAILLCASLNMLPWKS